MAEQTRLPVRTDGRRLSRWDPFEMLDAMQEEMARFWSQAWPWPLGRPFRRAAEQMVPWAPRMDVYEKDNNLVVKAELPGVKREDIEVALEGNDLEIKGERRAESEVKEENYYRMERSYGSFYRRLPLPFEVKPDQIQANYADGVLEIRIPKPAEQKPQAQKIPIK